MYQKTPTLSPRSQWLSRDDKTQTRAYNCENDDGGGEENEEHLLNTFCIHSTPKLEKQLNEVGITITPILQVRNQAHLEAWIAELEYRVSERSLLTVQHSSKY